MRLFNFILALGWTLAFVGSLGLLMSCGPRPLSIPPQASPAVEVLVPVAVPCKVVKVPASALPTQAETVPDDIFRAVQLVLADRAVLKGDVAKLTAANSDPCPQPRP